MTTLIILIALIAIGWYLTTVRKDDLIGFVICAISITLLLLHVPCWGFTSYDYKIFVEKRNAIEQTLKNARENDNKYENVAVMTEIVKWNTELAERKYNNKTILLDQYIDDRVEVLEPIK